MLLRRIKPVFIISPFFVAIVLLFPLLVQGSRSPASAASRSPSPGPFSELWLEGSKAEAEPVSMKSIDESTRVELLKEDGSTEAVSMKDYLIGVVAAEMPALFEREALKAQAVAARTYTLYRMTEDRAHEGGRLCTAPGCCNAYADLDSLKEKWGADYEANLARITEAVVQTDGICLSYEGRPIFAAFHSSSVGRTEDSENVWKGRLPYLRSVESPERADEVPNFTYGVTIAFNEVKRLVREAFPEARLGKEPEKWLTEAVYTQNGRLARVKLGGVELSGSQLRALFDLRSAAVTWSIAEDGIKFETKGYGHGVGMSQYGANAMAKAGADYIEILKHYYTDIDIAVASAAEIPKDSV